MADTEPARSDGLPEALHDLAEVRVRRLRLDGVALSVGWDTAFAGMDRLFGLPCVTDLGDPARIHLTPILMSEDLAPYAARPDAPAFTPSRPRLRVWDPVRGRMWQPDEVNAVFPEVITGGPDLFEVTGGPMVHGGAGLLSTGLHDANGREVFVGDDWQLGDEPPHRIESPALFAFFLADCYGITDPKVAAEGRVVGNAYEGVRE